MKKSAVEIWITGLSLLVRVGHAGRRTGGQIMDVIMVHSCMPEMTHHPVLLAPKGTVTFEHGLLTPADETIVTIPDGWEAWSLKGLELRFVDELREQKPVARMVADEIANDGTVTCETLKDWRTLSKLGDVGKASGGTFDKKYLGNIATIDSPVGARVRLSRGTIQGEAAPETKTKFWQLKADSAALPARPLTEILSYRHPRSGSAPILMSVYSLAGKFKGALALTPGHAKGVALELRNYPAPTTRTSVEVLEHFEAYYDLLTGVKRKPVPHYWGRSEQVPGGRDRLVLATEEVSGASGSGGPRKVGILSLPEGPCPTASVVRKA